MRLFYDRKIAGGYSFPTLLAIILFSIIISVSAIPPRQITNPFPSNTTALDYSSQCLSGSLGADPNQNSLAEIIWHATYTGETDFILTPSFDLSDSEKGYEFSWQGTVPVVVKEFERVAVGRGYEAKTLTRPGGEKASQARYFGGGEGKLRFEIDVGRPGGGEKVLGCAKWTSSPLASVGDQVNGSASDTLATATV